MCVYTYVYIHMYVCMYTHTHTHTHTTHNTHTHTYTSGDATTARNNFIFCFFTLMFFFKTNSGNATTARNLGRRRFSPGSVTKDERRRRCRPRGVRCCDISMRANSFTAGTHSKNKKMCSPATPYMCSLTSLYAAVILACAQTRTLQAHIL